MNRKNVIRAFLTIITLTFAVGAFTYIVVKNERLEETLHENEKKLSETSKKLETALLQMDAQDRVNSTLRFQKEELVSTVKELNDKVSRLTQAHGRLVEENKKLQQDYNTLKKNKAIAAEKARQQKTSSQLAQSASMNKKDVVVSRSNNQTATKTFYVTATAYNAYCAGCSGTTATGIDLRGNPGLKVIAVDPSVIPLGSKVWVEGYGYAVAGDTGGAIKGNKIDLFMPSESNCRDWGVRKVQIKVF